ncbi:MAG: N-acetyltransferase [Calditrichaeota bacterium]|nr:MAG: N-acetyltransferase [Calditrichota bacterium]
MLFEENSLSKKDLTEITKMHIDSLEDSMLTILGESVVFNYYKFISESNLDCLFLVKEGDTVIGTCMISHEPNSITKRMALKYPIVILSSVLKQIIISSDNRKKIFQFLDKDNEAPKSVLGLPEVIQIFTNSNYRNRRIGSRLLEQVESYLKKRNEKVYCLKTLDKVDNLALHFYSKRNFVEVGKNVVGEKPYVYFTKTLQN